MSDYNGWKNYETWCVKLWIDNDEGEQDYWTDRARDHHDVNEYDHAVVALAEELKDYWDRASDERLESYGGKVPNCVYADLLNAALSEVDWYEIAEALLNDNEEIAEAEVP